MPSIATVYVEVLPETSKIAAGIERAFRDVDLKAREAGKRWAREIETGMGSGPKVKLEADTEKAKAEIKSAAEDQKATIEVDADTAAAETQIDAAARDRTVKIRVETDKSALSEVKSALSKAGDDLGKVGGILGGQLKIFGAVQGLALSPNIVPAVGAVVQSVGQLSGLLGLLPAVAGTAGLAIGSLKIATAGFGDALKAMGDPKKFGEAIAKLSPNAQQAALSIQGLMPQINTLRATVQDAGFKGMGEQITALGTTYLPQFRTVMSQMAASANQALTGVSKMFQTPAMQADVKTFTGNAAVAFNTLSKSLEPVVHAFANIATVGSGFLPQIAGHITNAANAFDRFITNARDTGKLHDWIQGGIDAFTHLKDIVVNIGSTLMSVFRDAAGPGGGGGLLATIDRLTGKLRDFVNSPQGQLDIKQFFADARGELEKWKPTLEKLPGIAANVFVQLKNSTDRWFPILKTIADLLDRYPGLITGVVTAFGAWKTISGISSLLSTLKNVSTAISALSGVAKIAGGGIGTGLTSGLGAMGFVRVAAGWSLPIAIAVAITYSILKGDTSNQPPAPGAPGGPGPNASQPGLFDPHGQWGAGGNLNLPPAGAPPGTQQPIRLPGQRPGNPPSTTIPGQTDGINKDTPGAVPIPGGNGWMIPYLVSDSRSTAGAFTTTPPSSSGSREPDQGPITANPPSPPPDQTLSTPPVVAPPPGPQVTNPGGPGGGGNVGGGIGGPVAPSGFDWDAVMPHEGGTWSNADTGHNGHYGGLQFSPETWAAYGGLEFASRADYASPEEQKTVADRTAFYGYNGLAPQGLGAWEAITKGTVPGITTKTVPPRPTPQYGSALMPSSSSSSSSTIGAKVNQGAVPQPPAGGFPQGANVTYTAQTMQSLGIPALYTNPAGGGAAQIPKWVQDFVQLHGGPSLVAQSVPHPGLHGAAGGPGWAIDVTGDPADMDRLAQYLVDNPSESAQLIHQSASGHQYGVAGGVNVSGSYYGNETYQSESGMVHWAPSGPLTGKVTTDASGNVVSTADTTAASNKGEDLGKSFVDGLFAAFGFDGTVFKDPRQFGIVKLGTALLNYFNKVGNAIANPTTDANGNPINPNASSPNGDVGPGGGDLVSSLTSLVPQPFGPPKPADNTNNNNGVAVDNSFHLTVGDTKADTEELAGFVADNFIMSAREPLKNLPVPPQ